MCFAKLLGILGRSKVNGSTTAGGIPSTDPTLITPPTLTPSDVSNDISPTTPISSVGTPGYDGINPPQTTLPHPEEPENKAQTVANISIDAVFQVWFDSWDVPIEHRDYWRNAIDIQVYDSYPQSILNMKVKPTDPGVSWESEGKRHYACLATWFNAGVTAHEQAHNSHALLEEQQKTEFSIELQQIRPSNQLIELMFQKHENASKNDVEAHAEIYRYIGQQMPERLKQYYQKLF